MTGANLCVHCGRPCPDGYADTDCAHQAGDRLHDIADMTPAARDIATGMARHGSGGSSEAESRIPLNLGATQRLNAVQTCLGGWARHVAETRGGRPQPVGTDPIAHAALYLAGNVEWMRHRQEADEFLSDVELCHRVVRGLARGPSEQKFLGPCGAPMPLLELTASGEVVAVAAPICEGDVYAYRGARTGRCKTCKAEVATSEREAWLDGEVRQHAFTAKDIADAHGLNVKTIRTWANRGQLKTYWRTEAGLVTPWADLLEGATPEDLSAAEVERGPRLHYVGDVLDLAAAEAGRRATEQAKRARRAAAKAAESEDAA